MRRRSLKPLKTFASCKIVNHLHSASTWPAASVADLFMEQSAASRPRDRVAIVGRPRGLRQDSDVPEPSTWAMMILGFAGVGFMAYRRSRKSSPMVLSAA